MSARLRILVALVNAAAKIGDYLLTTFAPSEPPRGWHPSTGPRPEPEQPEPLRSGTAALSERETEAVRAFMAGTATEDDHRVMSEMVHFILWADELEGAW